MFNVQHLSSKKSYIKHCMLLNPQSAITTDKHLKAVIVEYFGVCGITTSFVTVHVMSTLDVAYPLKYNQELIKLLTLDTIACPSNFCILVFSCTIVELEV